MKAPKRLHFVGHNANNNESPEQPRHTRNHRIRYEQSVPHQFSNNLVPSNVCEQKDRFLRRNLTPEFHLNVPTSELESALLNGSGNITFTLFREATRILDVVCKRFKSLDNFVEHNFGPRISVDQATEKITEYIKESNLPTSLDVIWCEDLAGSALMCSTGIDKNGNIPRQRKFTMLLKTNEENTYLRETGIISLMDHELGTHYHRSFNEGLQPWYGKREIYGLGPTNTNEAIKIEEGLACIHTILRAKHRYLGIPALLYYGSCMAEYLPFKDLFEHLGKYVADEEQRWKHCMRIKRCLPSQDRCGGYGKDQRYFEGAVAILRQQANIDFPLLMAGKLTLSELERIRRCAILGPIRLPTFMLNKEKYLATLRQIAHLNGISITKRVTEKQRSRSQVLSCDQKIVPVTSGSVPVTTSASFRSSMPLTSKHSPSPLSSFSSSEVDETTKREKTKKRRKHVRETDRTPLPKLDSACSEQNVTQITQQLGTKVSKISSKLEPNQSPSFPERPGSPDSAICEMRICSYDINPMHSARQAVRTRIMQALSDFHFPVSQLSNSFLRNACKVTREEPEQTKPHKEHYIPKRGMNSDQGGLENELQSLPLGVCGCRLFTHGSLKFPVDQITAVLKSTKNKSKSSSAFDDPVGVRKARVPMVLEIDLRHPLIGV
ncbi:hypothetical protein PHET_06006 [Paragonimus heterotremus]|uniref:Uncharacterized protein n=1 Tax=Paragonimus heterotremus TaxID=100268 RepID=A0A8J4WHN4_9TREM|nr:hypothetical protein PHET_06006 [Paragonimus heterotremus]